MLELNVNKSKTLPELTAVRRGVITAAADGQFSLILDQAVGETQETTAAADNLPDTGQPAPHLDAPRGKLLNAIGSLFDKMAGATLTEQTTPVSRPKNKNYTSKSEDTEIEKVETEKTPNSAPINLIQTQAEQITEKNPRVSNVLTEIEGGSEKLFTTTTPTAAPLPFTEIYAELLQSVQIKKDGQVLKFKLALEPENLGKIEVYIFADKKNLQVAFAAGEDVRKMLAADASALKNILEKYGFSQANMDFSNLAGRQHQELENRFLAQEKAANDFGVLKTISQNDIIKEVRFLLGKVLVHYLA